MNFQQLKKNGGIMKKRYWFYLFILFLICFHSPSFPQGELTPKVNQIFNEQLEALKANSYGNFIKRGNKAFKELFTKFEFETIYLDTKSKLVKEYIAKFLGSIQRVGMTEYLWKFKNKDDKNEHLVSLTLSKNEEYVIGFDFD